MDSPPVRQTLRFLRADSEVGVGMIPEQHTGFSVDVDGLPLPALERVDISGRYFSRSASVPDVQHLVIACPGIVSDCGAQFTVVITA